MIVVVGGVGDCGGCFGCWWWFQFCGYGFFVLRLILSGLVNWVCLDLEKNMKNEVHILGWRFDDFSKLVFSRGFRFDDFFMFWRFRWRIGILYEILHCSRFDCSWIRE